jgi:hypothetical protein
MDGQLLTRMDGCATQAIPFLDLLDRDPMSLGDGSQYVS